MLLSRRTYCVTLPDCYSSCATCLSCEFLSLCSSCCVLISHHVEDDDGKDCCNDEQEDGDCRSNTDLLDTRLTESALVYIHKNCLCTSDVCSVKCNEWRILVDVERNIVHLETTDHRCYQEEKHDRTEQRQCDSCVCLEGVSTIELSWLIEWLRDGSNSCDQDDHCITVPHPEVDERYD